MKIIDCHYHNRYWFWEGESYLDAQKKYREAAGLETINYLCAPGIENGSPNGGAGVNCMAAILKVEDEAVYAYAGLIYPWSNEPNPHAPEYDLKIQVQEVMALGFDGIKMMEGKPSTYVKLQYRVDSDYYKDFFADMEQEQIPLLWHVADPEAFWDPERAPEAAFKNGWFYGNGKFPSRHRIYGEVYTILERYPKLKLILGHCFFLSPYPDEIKRLLDTYENLCFDLTPAPEIFRDFSANREVWRDIFEKYYKRFMFGTDINSGYDLEYRKFKVDSVVRFFTTDDEFQAFGGTVRGFALDEEKCEYSLGKSFTEYMGRKPKIIDKSALKQYAERHAKHIPEGETKDMILKYCAENL